MDKNLNMCLTKEDIHKCQIRIRNDATHYLSLGKCKNNSENHYASTRMAKIQNTDSTKY